VARKLGEQHLRGLRVTSPHARADPAPQTDRRHSRRSLLKHGVAVAIAGLTLYVVFPSLMRVAASWPRLRTLSPLWLIAALAAELTSFVCTFALQGLVLRSRRRFTVATASLAGNAVSNVVPGGDAAGLAVQFSMLETAGLDSDTAAAGLAAVSLLDVGGLLALPVFTLPAVLGGAPVSRGLVHAALLGLGGFALFAAGGIAVIATDRPLAVLGRTAQWLWNRIPGRRANATGLAARLLVQRDSIVSTLGRNWRRAVLLVGGRLGFDYLCLLGALRATGSTPRPSLVLLAYAVAGVITWIPLTPGGLGLVEASLSGLLVLAGASPSSAVVATLAYRLANYWLPLLAGAVAYLLFRRRYGPPHLSDRGLTETSR
jgi:uncharacterized membrane protein YbhN (UPF0104 family)